MKLSTRSRYGTRLILDLAIHGRDGPVRIKDIAKRQGVSVKYLEKLVHELQAAGYVKSRRGPRGGHELAKPLETISVGDIVRTLEGDFRLVGCDGPDAVCPRAATCPTRDVWIEAARAMHRSLDAVTLADLAARQGAFCGIGPRGQGDAH